MADRFAKPSAYLARIIKIAVLAVVVVHGIEEARHRGRRVRTRAGRRATDWFVDAEHHERDELYEAELKTLARWLSRTESQSRRGAPHDRVPPTGKA